MPDYDVIVVGAGNAALAAQIQLMKPEQKSFILEKANKKNVVAILFFRVVF